MLLHPAVCGPGVPNVIYYQPHVAYSPKPREVLRVREVPVPQVREVVRRVPVYSIYEPFVPSAPREEPLKRWTPPLLTQRTPSVPQQRPSRPPRLINPPPPPRAPEPKVIVHSARRPTQKRPSKAVVDVDQISRDCMLSQLSTGDLVSYAIAAAAALAARDDDDDEDSEGTEGIELASIRPRGPSIEVVCPTGVKPGDTIDVRIPSKAGGGIVSTTIPAGVVAGEAFDVYPPQLNRHKRRSRHR